MVAMTYIKRTQTFTIALSTRYYNTTRDEMVTAFTTTKTIVRNLAQYLQVLLMAFIRDNTDDIIGIKDCSGIYQFVGTISTGNTADHHLTDRENCI